MSNSNTVIVTTVVRDSLPTTADFNTPGLVAFVAGAWVGVQSFDVSPDGLVAALAAGLSDSSVPYLVLQAMASQENHCTTLKVYSRAAANAQAYTFTPVDTTVGHTVGFTLVYGGVEHDVAYEVETGDAPTDIVTGLTTSLGVVTGLTIGGTTTLTVELTDETDGERFFVRDVLGLTIEDTSADAGIAADLAAAQVADPDFYVVMIDSTSAAEISAAATWVAANTKLGAFNSADQTNATNDDGVAYDLGQLDNDRAAVFVTRDTLGQGIAGLVGKELAQAAGSDNWAHKSITGQLPDGWTQTELDFIRANGGIAYISEYGLPHTLDGATAGGRYIDITRGIDWLNANIRSGQLAVFLNNEKVPYTNPGAALLEDALRRVLGQAEGVGLLAPGWTTTRGKVEDQSASDKANRVFPDLKWQGVLQGAMNSVTVYGTVVP